MEMAGGRNRRVYAETSKIAEPRDVSKHTQVQVARQETERACKARDEAVRKLELGE